MELKDIVKGEIDRIKDIIPENDITENNITGISLLKTPGINIEDIASQEVIINSKHINDKYLQSHLKEYPELNTNILTVKEIEERYKWSLCTTLNSIIDELNEIERSMNSIKWYEKHKNIEPTPSIAIYYTENIIRYMLDDINFSSIKDFIINEAGIKARNETGPIVDYKNGKLSCEEIQNFLNICQKVYAEHKDDIKKYKDLSKSINKIYRSITKDFEDKIIDDLDSGRQLKGTCDKCKKIDEGEKNKSLMPHIK